MVATAQVETTESHVSEFVERGYTIVRNAVSADAVEAIRAECERFRRSRQTDGGAEMSSLEFARSDFAEIPFSKACTEPLAALLGSDFVIYPNYTMRADRQTSWHVDNGFLYHNDRDDGEVGRVIHAQCIVYLQDNHPDYGGGLQVLPGSHRLQFRRLRERQLETKIEPGAKRNLAAPVSLASRAGDLVIFNGWLMHRSSQGRARSPHHKFSLFWSTSNFHPIAITAFVDYLLKRADELDTHERAWLEHQTSSKFRNMDARLDRLTMFVDRYSKIKDLRFPDSFSDRAVAAIKQSQATLIAFDDESRPLWLTPRDR